MRLLLLIITMVCTPAWASDGLKNVMYPGGVEIEHSRAIPAELSYFGNYFIVNIEINGKGPYPFLFDTGAAENYITYNLAEKYGMNKIHVKKRNILSSVKTMKVEQSLFMADTITIGGAIFTDVPFQSGANRHRDPAALQEIGVAGIIGITMFEPVLLTLDLGNEKIFFSDNLLNKNMQGVTPIVRTDKIVPIILGNVHSEKYQGSHSFILDSGNYSNFHFYLCSEIQKEPAKDNRFTLKTKDFMMNEKTDYFTTLKGSITIGNTGFINPKITYSLEVCSEKWQFPRDGLIGANTMKKMRLSIDQKNDLVLILPR